MNTIGEVDPGSRNTGAPLMSYPWETRDKETVAIADALKQAAKERRGSAEQHKLDSNGAPRAAHDIDNRGDVEDDNSQTEAVQPRAASSASPTA